MDSLRAAVVTVSDGVVAGTREDRSGQAVEDTLRKSGHTVEQRLVVADEIDEIEAVLRALIGVVQLVATTGGTGLGPRDVTPEATSRIVEREIPGLFHLMMTAGLASTPHAALSRGVVGAAGTCLIVNLPGNPSGAVENLEAILPILPHVVRLLAGDTAH